MYSVNTYPYRVDGNLGDVEELRFMPSGKAVLNFGLASYAGKSKTGVKETCWLDVSTFGAMAEKLARVLKSGMSIRIFGYMAKQPRFWRVKETGDLMIDEKSGEPMFSYRFVAWEAQKIARIVEVKDFDDGKEMNAITALIEAEEADVVALTSADVGDVPF